MFPFWNCLWVITEVSFVLPSFLLTSIELRSSGWIQAESGGGWCWEASVGLSASVWLGCSQELERSQNASLVNYTKSSFSLIP